MKTVRLLFITILITVTMVGLTFISPPQNFNRRALRAAPEGCTFANPICSFTNDGLMDFVVGNWNKGYALYHS
jgi:hypothetical protein